MCCCPSRLRRLLNHLLWIHPPLLNFYILLMLAIVRDSNSSSLNKHTINSISPSYLCLGWSLIFIMISCFWNTMVHVSFRYLLCCSFHSAPSAWPSPVAEDLLFNLWWKDWSCSIDPTVLTSQRSRKPMTGHTHYAVTSQKWLYWVIQVVESHKHATTAPGESSVPTQSMQDICPFVSLNRDIFQSLSSLHKK